MPERCIFIDIKEPHQRIADSDLSREARRFDNGGVLSRTFQRRLMRDLRDARQQLANETHAQRVAIREELALLNARFHAIELTAAVELHAPLGCDDSERHTSDE